MRVNGPGVHHMGHRQIAIVCCFGDKFVGLVHVIIKDISQKKCHFNIVYILLLNCSSLLGFDAKKNIFKNVIIIMNFLKTCKKVIIKFFKLFLLCLNKKLKLFCILKDETCGGFRNVLLFHSEM